MVRWKLTSWKQALPIVLGVSLVGTSMVVPLSTPAYAQTVGPQIPIVIDGQSLQLDVQPVIQNNRVLVPLRGIFESLGAQVNWNGATQTVTAVKGQTSLKIPINSSNVYKNGQLIHLDVPATIHQDRTFVPVRFVSEALGDTVTWVNHSVIIQTPQSQNQDQSQNQNQNQNQNPNQDSAPGPTSETSQLAPPIQVVAGDAIVTPQQLQSVNKIIQDSGIVAMLEQDLNQTFQQPVTIQVAANQQGYQAMLLQAGISTSDATTITDGSSGMALDNTVYFPLSDNPDTGMLRNILAHELTHVLLNQAGVGDTIPSWVNEGIAWTEGLKAEYQSASQVLYQGKLDFMRENILDAYQTSDWQPLLSDPEATILATSAYNVEWQDYFAVNLLQQTYGSHALTTYLQDLLQQTPEQAFQAAFGVSEASFEQTYDQTLANWKQKAVSGAVNGVEVKLRVSDSFQGNIGILPVGRKTWKLYQVKGGTYTIDVLPDGTVTGLDNQVGTAVSPDSPDPETVFVGIEPDQSVREDGKSLARAGFALVSKYGQAYYLNSWTIDSSQQSNFDSNITHLGVQLLDVQPLSK